MKIRTLISYLALAASLSLPAQLALASGTSSYDVEVLAKKGSKIAQRILGQRYAMGGRGLPQDMNQAVYWLQKAAERGDADAQYSLGVIYSQGVGIPRDWVQAHMWFSLVGSSGEPVTPHDREQVEKNLKIAQASMTAAQLEEAQALASAWLAQHKVLAQAAVPAKK